MEKETKIEDIAGKLIEGNVIDMDFKDIKGFVPEIRKMITPKEWEKEREKILKTKLP
jgi:hypothetical protein